METNYTEMYKLDPDESAEYDAMYDYATRKTSTFNCRKNKEAAVRIYNKIFKNHKHIDKSIHLDAYHDTFDNHDCRFEQYLKKYKYCSFWTELGQKKILSELFKIEYYIYLSSGHDMADNQTLNNFRKDCDYIFISHNRTYSYKKGVKYVVITSDSVHAKIEDIIGAVHNLSHAELKDYFLLTLSHQKYIDFTKKKISYEDRKSQLTCSKHNMSKYASNFENYLCTLYQDPDSLSRKQIHAERKSYQYYMIKFGLHSTNRPGRPAKKSSKINVL